MSYLIPADAAALNQPLWEYLRGKPTAGSQWSKETFANYLEFCRLLGGKIWAVACEQMFRTGVGENFPRVSEQVPIQAFYVALRLDQLSHKCAEMLALQKPPMSNTDREFLEGHCNGNQFEKTPHLGDAYLAEARRAGVDVTGKVYLSGLAAYPGDPEAWVSGRGDVQRVVEQRGWACEGSVNIKATRMAEPTGGGIASSLVDAAVEARLEEHPEPERVNRQELRQSIIDQHAPSWAKQEV